MALQIPNYQVTPLQTPNDLAKDQLSMQQLAGQNKAREIENQNAPAMYDLKKQQAQLEVASQKATLLKQSLGGIMAVDPTQRASAYQQTRQRLIQQGVIGEQDAPTDYDEGFVKAQYGEVLSLTDKIKLAELQMQQAYYKSMGIDVPGFAAPQPGSMGSLATPTPSVQAPAAQSGQLQGKPDLSQLSPQVNAIAPAAYGVTATDPTSPATPQQMQAAANTVANNISSQSQALPDFKSWLKTEEGRASSMGSNGKPDFANAQKVYMGLVKQNREQPLLDARIKEAEAKSKAAESKLNSQSVGKQRLGDILDEMSSLYTNLYQGGGAVSTDQNALQNVTNWAANTQAGQSVGQMFGTENQSIRNRIAANIPLISAAIKDATGMSSQQMNSNFELQQYLKALSSPTNDVQANLSILNKIYERFVGGDREQPAAQETTDDGWSMEPAQ